MQHRTVAVARLNSNASKESIPTSTNGTSGSTLSAPDRSARNIQQLLRGFCEVNYLGGLTRKIYAILVCPLTFDGLVTAALEEK